MGDAERLQNVEDNGEVAGPLGDFAAAEFAFLLEFFKGGYHDGQQLQDDVAPDEPRATGDQDAAEFSCQ